MLSFINQQDSNSDSARWNAAMMTNVNQPPSRPTLIVDITIPRQLLVK